VAKRRGLEVLFIVVIVGLVSTWSFQDRIPNVPGAVSAGSSSPFVPREISINGVRLGMTLEQVTALLGRSLSEVDGKLIGDTYSFGQEPGAMGYADFTGVQLDDNQRVTFIQGNRLEVDGKRVAEDFWALPEEEKAETVKRLEELFGEAKFQSKNGARKAVLAREELMVDLSRNGSWTFRLGKQKKG
jgi:hypothetical protein